MGERVMGEPLDRVGGYGPERNSFGLSVLFSASTIYILLLVFSPDHLYSREYSRILRIFSSLGRSTKAKVDRN